MELKIYTDRIRDGKTFHFSGTVSAGTILPPEKDLLFDGDLSVSGEAYIAGDHLVIKMSAETIASLPCSVCNKLTHIPLKISDFYHTEPVEEVSSGIFDFSSILRDDLLLEVPQFTECKGKCPEREALKKYFKKDCKKSSTENTHLPFADL